MDQQQGLIKITDHVHDPAVQVQNKKNVFSSTFCDEINAINFVFKK